MTDSQFTGRWEGFYSYGSGNVPNSDDAKIGFVAEMFLKDGAMTGTCEESVTREQMKKPAVLTGFIEGNWISFIKKYPFHFQIAKDGSVLTDPKKPSHSIHYSGLFDPVLGRWQGDWEIDTFVQDNFNGNPNTRMKGRWEMWKIPD